MTLRITVLDIETGDTSAMEIAEGDYMLICHEPCHRAGVQTFIRAGTHVITVKGHAPKHPPRVVET